MTSINPAPLERAASVGTLLTNSRKRAPRAFTPRGIVKGAQGLRVQLGNGLTRTKQKTDLCADDAKLYSRVSCIEGRSLARWGTRKKPRRTDRATSSRPRRGHGLG